MDIEFTFHYDLSYLEIYFVKRSFHFCECLITACNGSSSHIAQKKAQKLLSTWRVNL